MAKIQDIPAELLALIFKQLYLACRGRRELEWYSDESDYEEDDDSFEMVWTDGNIHAATNFPFNVANVCKLWRDVALQSAENWVSLAFDLAKDPQPLLGAFSASGSLPFSVSIVNTANDLAEDGKIREHDRARSIVLHLEPHAQRCTSIVFKLTFASSLPSPVLFLASNPTELTDLQLDYQVYDLPQCYKGTQIHPKPTPCTLEKLTSMTMTGSAFMDILHLGTKWLKSVQAGKQDKRRHRLTLHVRDFQFPAPGDDMVDKIYTFANFIRLLYFFNPMSELYLENLSLAYRPHSRAGEASLEFDLSECNWENLNLDNVSPDFLLNFFRICGLDVAIDVYFMRCSIPPLPGDTSVYSLSLQDIPEDDSLYNIVSGWERGSICLNSCPAFNDKFIRWLCDDRGDGKCEAHGIKVLDIMDCENFTAGAIRRLLAVVNDPVKSAKEGRGDEDRLTHLIVSGQGPPLEEEDLEWLKSYNGETTVGWYVKNKDGYSVDFCSRELCSGA